RKIHSRLIEEANLAALDTLEQDEIRSEIDNVVGLYLSDEKALLNDMERSAL
ncbi:MAG: CpaF family protein, partial [Phycisphaerae bacterium]|nr:CpaF family protein [Phycisphaerae bacterium]NIW40773.1 CpaF family protein [candidate division Zixibacteria bacterium]NIX02178.1 CpaF family protein [Phycisphaerae bacterium]